MNLLNIFVIINNFVNIKHTTAQWLEYECLCHSRGHVIEVTHSKSFRSAPSGKLRQIPDGQTVGRPPFALFPNVKCISDYAEVVNHVVHDAPETDARESPWCSGVICKYIGIILYFMYKHIR